MFAKAKQIVFIFGITLGFAASAQKLPPESIVSFLRLGPRILNFFESFDPTVQQSIQYNISWLIKSHHSSRRPVLGRAASSAARTLCAQELPKLDGVVDSLYSLKDTLPYFGQEAQTMQGMLDAMLQVRREIQRCATARAADDIEDLLRVLTSSKFTALDVWGKFYHVLKAASQYRDLRPEERIPFRALSKRVGAYARAVNAVLQTVRDTSVSRNVHYVGGPLGAGAPFLAAADALKLEQQILNYNMRAIAAAYSRQVGSCSDPLT